jgi:hypothetical protein
MAAAAAMAAKDFMLKEWKVLASIRQIRSGDQLNFSASN